MAEGERQQSTAEAQLKQSGKDIRVFKGTGGRANKDTSFDAGNCAYDIRVMVDFADAIGLTACAKRNNYGRRNRYRKLPLFR